MKIFVNMVNLRSTNNDTPLKLYLNNINQKNLKLQEQLDQSKSFQTSFMTNLLHGEGSDDDEDEMEIRKEEQILEVAESVTLQNLSCLSEEFEDQGGALSSLMQLNKNIEKNRSRMTGNLPKAETQK